MFAPLCPTTGMLRPCPSLAGMINTVNAKNRLWLLLLAERSTRFYHQEALVLLTVHQTLVSVTSLRLH